jgi:predicted ATPase
VQDAAYGTLLREPRRALHAHIAATLESEFPDVAEKQPELLARHYTQAGQIEKASGFWIKAGQRSLGQSALVEGVEQLTRALAQLATLPNSPALRAEQIKVQAALINPLMHLKGYASLETKAVVEQARLLIEQAEALGEPSEDPLLLFSVLYGVWAANYVAFNGDVVCELAAQFSSLAKKHGTTAPLLQANRVMGISLLHTGDVLKSRKHFDSAMALYDPVEHRSLAMRFGVDARVSVLSYRSWTLWLLGYPEAALADAEQALKDAREIGHAATLMFALGLGPHTHLLSGNYAKMTSASDELAALADEKDAVFWKASTMVKRGWLFAVTGKAADAVHILTSGTAARRSTGATLFAPLSLSYLGMAYAELGQFDDASRCIDEATATIKATKESWFEAEANRIAGELALMTPKPDVGKAEERLERSLAVARRQQAKSWELRAAMSLARLWRSQGKVQEARELLAPVYGWFTEGFDTRDLKEAKVLLEELAT